MTKHKYFLFKIISFILVFNSCTLKPSVEKNGVINLDTKQQILKPNLNNKNDVIKILGESLIKEYPNEKSWLYFETENKKNLIGKKIYIKNNVLLLDFDDKGILLSKKLLTIKDIKETDFDEELSKVYAIDNSLLNKFFYSVRKRVQNQKSKFKKK